MKAEYRGASDDVSVDVAALGGALWRAKRWLVPLVLVAAVGTFAGLQLITPKYRGEAKILIESQGPVYPGADRGVEGERALLDQEGVASQVQLLRSHDLARRVAQKLNLAELEEYNPSAPAGDSVVRDALRLMGLAGFNRQSSVEERVLESYFKHLTVFQVEKTRVITVEFASQDPELAAKAANVIVQEYLDLQAGAKRDHTAEAAGNLGPEVDRVRRDVEAAERKVEEYRAGADLLLGNNNVTLIQQQLADLNTQLATARAQKAEVAAKAEQLRAMLKRGSLDSASDVLNSPLIQRLRERQVALQARLAELSTSLLPTHPAYRALQRQLDDLSAQIVGEARKILGGLENDVRVAQSREVSLLASLNELKAQVAQNNDARIRMRELERDAKVKGAQLESLLQRYREQDSRRNSNALPPDARLISRAAVPLKPYSPRVVPITVLVTLAVLLLSVTYVLMREFLSGGALVRTSVPGREGPMHAGALAAPVLMPAPESPDLPVSDVDTSPAELWARLVEEGQVPKCMVVVSTEDNDLANRAALALLRVAVIGNGCPILVETVGSGTGADEADDGPAGLTDLLAGKASFSQAIMRDPRSRAHVIAAAGDPLDDVAAASPSFDTVMEALEHTYDTIIVDLGQLTSSLATAKFLAHADHVVLVAGDRSGGPSLDRTRRLLESQTGTDISILAPPRRDVPPPGARDMAA